MKIEIKKARISDINVIERFWKECLPYFPFLATKRWTKESRKRFMEEAKKKRTIFLLAFDNEKLVGQCEIAPGKDRTSIRATMGITVHPAYQRKGIGMKLMQAAISEARKKKLKKLEAEVVCKNEASVVLFRKAGFRIEGKKRKCFLSDEGKLLDTYIFGKVL